MGMLQFFKGLAVSEGKKDQANELKRLKAIEDRLISMEARYTQYLLDGRTRCKTLSVLHEIEKVLGEPKHGKVLR